ncbi:hypothetical protein COEREDRAFT_86746 [Coemansia reversa NRRL 1564]|uniref:Rad21/Rec8-like protein N-terminal domain-containing protein n=1 Tax=Coemansia reversa (strain ATCC 12441 / NRRL 1564) TaxID=763665 RepID=A0A2G5BD70_COERN|nr:hypothetical protein COEREDRAFT_86746 [Coemansia reversa NRRL 1564]|eukprot:PIA16657.1 hypothetical protein COEREDRAFT_86746 [Coemansia reversa NRRL 1564]
MFYSQDLLCRRGGRFGVIWLLATSGGNSRRLGVNNRELMAIDIARTCTEIIVPPVPLSLRLSSTLLIGLVRALARKSDLLFSDCHSTWSRILATPWITSKQGFDPFISAHTTVSSTQVITLPSVCCLEYLDMPDVVDAVAIDEPSRAHADSQLQIWRELGWLGPVTMPRPSSQDNISSAQQLDGQSFTSSWSSLSIPDPLAYCNESGGFDRLHSATPTSAKAICLGTTSISAGRTPPPAIGQRGDPASHANEASPDIGLDEADNAEFYFDNNGNIHFTSTELGGTSHGLSTVDVHTEELVQITPNLTRQVMSSDVHLMAGTNSNRQVPRVDALVGSNRATVTGTVDIDNQHIDMPCDESSAACHSHSSVFEGDECDNNTFQLQQRSLDVLHVLEEVEDDVLHNWNALVTHPPVHMRAESGCNSRTNHAKRRRLNNGNSDYKHCESEGCTYESRVEALWARSCFWDKEMLAKSASTLGMRAQILVRTRASNMANIYALPYSIVMEQIFRPPLWQTDDARSAVSDIYNSPDQGSEWLDNMDVPVDSPNNAELHFDDNNDSELELGRGGSPIANSQNNDEDYLLNMDLDIPWLQPEILKEVKRQQNITHTPSIRTESSVDYILNRQTSGSRQSTPASHVPSLDPPSSDDGLDIQHFELAAQNLDTMSATNNVLDTRGLDSFLDLSALSAKVGDNNTALRAAEMNHEALCFHRFVLTRMRDCSSDRLSFNDLLPLPCRARRVAARAFVDLLQMASRSVFSVKQAIPYSDIFMSSS